jgi:hypothetical protein
MQTAIFVYETTSVTFNTEETDLQLCGMGGQTASPLSPKGDTRSMSPGIYKIVSNHDVEVHDNGNQPAVETTTTNSKTDIPTLPVKAAQIFAPGSQAFNAFFATPDAKIVLNP